MAITRDANASVEMAQLLQAFNHCAESHSADVVLDASINMVAAAIGFIATSKGMTLPEADQLTRLVADSLERIVAINWHRKAQPTDIPVNLGS